MNRLERDQQTRLSWWFPRIKRAGLPVPATIILRAPEGLTSIADGGPFPIGFDNFEGHMLNAITRVGGPPAFIRTDFTSGKHDWERTCWYTGERELGFHIIALVEYSMMVDIMGLPVDVFAFRQVIPTTPIFHAFAGRMPIVREFRFFVRDGIVEHIQPYWPADAILSPDVADWRERLELAAELGERTGWHLCQDAATAGVAVGGGYWSVDFLEDATGRWWLIDMARGEDSYHSDSESEVAGTVDYAAMIEET